MASALPLPFGTLPSAISAVPTYSDELLPKSCVSLMTKPPTAANARNALGFDAVIAATSRDTHEEIETTLASLCRDHPVSVLCVYDRTGGAAGLEHLDLAVARHPDRLQEQRLALRRTAHTLYVDGEIDMSNLDVFATALRALTDTPSASVLIDLNGVTFLAAAGVRTLIRDTAPYRDRGADVEIHATPHITHILQLLDIHRLPQLHLSCRGVRVNSM